MKHSPDKIAAIRSLAPSTSAAKIALSLDLSTATVIRWAKEQNIPLLTRSESMKKHHAALGHDTADVDAQVPAWVHHSLAEEYVQLAAESGEEYAASVMRRRKSQGLWPV